MDLEPAVTNLLLRDCSCINTRGMWGNTPLLLASRYNHVTLVRLLIREGADVNAANDAEATALLYC